MQRSLISLVFIKVWWFDGVILFLGCTWYRSQTATLDFRNLSVFRQVWPSISPWGPENLVFHKLSLKSNSPSVILKFSWFYTTTLLLCSLDQLLGPSILKVLQSIRLGLVGLLACQPFWGLGSHQPKALTPRFPLEFMVPFFQHTRKQCCCTGSVTCEREKTFHAWSMSRFKPPHRSKECVSVWQRRKA